MRRSRRTYSSVDPFKPSVATSVKRLWSEKKPINQDRSHSALSEDDDLTSPPPKLSAENRTVSWTELNPNIPIRSPSVDLLSKQPTSNLPAHQFILAFIIDTLPRQLYLLLLLGLPYLYFSRVCRLFEEADLSIKDIKRGLLESARKQNEPWVYQGRQVTSEPYEALQKSWNEFVDALIQEWNTLNIVSVLLLGALLTALQLDGASTDPLTRFSALIAMLCSLMSLMYGCMYIIRFGTMRKTYKAAEWAHEAKQTKTGIWWNVWIMLALPAVWLAWSIILYIVCIMSYVWRTGADIDSNREPFTTKQALAPRIVVSVVLFLGLVYLVKIIMTLRRYGDIMDRAWQTRLQSWLKEVYSISQIITTVTMVPAVAGVNPYHPQQSDKRPPVGPGTHSTPSNLKPAASNTTDRGPDSSADEDTSCPIKVTKIMPLTDSEGETIFDKIPIPSEDVLEGHMESEDWRQLRNNIRAAWPSSPRQFPEALYSLLSPISEWNETYFAPRGGQIQICDEKLGERVHSFALYHFTTASKMSGVNPQRYSGVPERLEQLDVLDLVKWGDEYEDEERNWAVGRFGLWPKRD
ncbi:hypothetical protein BJ165DRAFT_1479493 [Panaeolus papilionaceus]|nr:hypothetical protein BJ165DRAFT_1479493 [Panaeolus papilionaceus]